MPTAPEGYFCINPEGKRVRVPSVTTVIGVGLGGYSKDALMGWAWKLGMEGVDYRERRDKAADAGTVAHALIEGHLSGKATDLRPYDDEVLEQGLTAFQAFKEWRSQHDIKVHYQETRLTDSEYMFGGCFDALIDLDGVLTLADWKSSKDIYGSMIAQVGAYHHLIRAKLPNELPDRAMILRCGKDGTLRIVELDAKAIQFGWETFQAALTVYRARTKLDALVADPNKVKRESPTMTLPVVGEKAA